MKTQKQLAVASSNYTFEGGYPMSQTVQNVYTELDLSRAVQMYRIFYPTVSAAAIFKGNLKAGVVPNKVFGTLDTKPRHIGFTYNSDTPYGPLLLDLSSGPMVVEVPPGPLMGFVLDLNQRWVADIGMPGPDEGKGGKHLILPPDYQGKAINGFYISWSTTYRVLAGMRSLPIGGDVPRAIELIKKIKVYPLNPPANWTEPTWLDLTPKPQDTTPVAWERNLQFWQELYQVVNYEPPFEGYREHYGELASLGIIKGKPFQPDERLQHILEQAARLGCAQMCVEAFADRRPDRIVWPERQWQWAALRPENGAFETPNYTDTYARDKWFYQAIGVSPAMFRREAGSGSVYWLGLRDQTGVYLDGGKHYKLTVPLPVPGQLFWSVTVYDAITRSQVSTDQGKAALRSLFELKDKLTGNQLDLYFGPSAPAGPEGQWIKTPPGRGWFAYFRVYGPEAAAFNGVWQPGDFELIK